MQTRSYTCSHDGMLIEACPRRPRYVRSLVVLGILLVGFVCAGCATSDPGSMPWNTPQPWEGTPGIPGVSGSRFDY